MMPTPTEAEEQRALFKLCAVLSGRYPELALLHHIPNGGSRNAAEAANLKRQGVKAGVPDIFLPVARKGYHGLYIELKRQEGGRLSDAQKWWIERLRRQGYAVYVCKGARAAARVICEYMNIKEIIF